MKYTPVLGRILFAIPMLMFGMGHFGQAQMMVDNGMVPSFLPAPIMVVYATGVVLVLVSLAIIAGFRTKQAALVLGLFLASTTFLVWAPMLASAGPEMEQVAFSNFMKDMGLAGAALYMSFFGAGPLSLDEKAAKTA